MNATKILSICSEYRQLLEGHGIKPQAYPHEQLLILADSVEPLEHCLQMLPQIEEMATKLITCQPQEKLELIAKINRWLGFIQGILFQSGLYTIEDMKNHNRPK